MSAKVSTASPLVHSCSNHRILRSITFSVVILAAMLLLACGALDDKPSTSAPGGIDDPDELWDACIERELAIYDWEMEKLRDLENAFAEGGKSLLDAATEQEKIEKEAGQMRWDLEANCATKADQLSSSAASSDKEKRSPRNCDDCLSLRQLNEEYEANSFTTVQRYKGTRHDFGGTVESIDQEPSVPPKPVVRVKSDGFKISFRFSFDEDYSWVLALSKGDWVKANCRIRSVDSLWSSGNTIDPLLEECTETD